MFKIKESELQGDHDMQLSYLIKEISKPNKIEREAPGFKLSIANLVSRDVDVPM